jgi:hypothetical protein
MATQITRRELAAVMAAPALAAQTPSPAAPTPPDPGDELKAARDQNRQNQEQLAKFPLPMATEPATHFKA